jgi:hypothetical protein
MTSFTDISAFFPMAVILATERSFCTFVDDDFLFFFG